jgi:hypothetical protein
MLNLVVCKVTARLLKVKCTFSRRKKLTLHSPDFVYLLLNCRMIVSLVDAKWIVEYIQSYTDIRRRNSDRRSLLYFSMSCMYTALWE